MVGLGKGSAGPLAAHEGAAELKKLFVRHIRFVPVRNTLSSEGHFLTGATNAAPVIAIPVSAPIHVRPPSVVLPIGPKLNADIQSVSGWLDEIAISASPNSTERCPTTCCQTPFPVRFKMPVRSRRPAITTSGLLGCRAPL